MAGGRTYRDIVTIGMIDVIQVSADPNGTAGPRGSLAVDDSSPPKVWQNTTGGTTWISLTEVLPTNYINGLPLAFTSLSSVTIGVGSARDSTDLGNIIATAPLPIDITTSGAGGLDTGLEAPSTWYAAYIIGGRPPIAGILSTSFVAPTLPVGYSTFRRVGSVRNGPASAFLPFDQVGPERLRQVNYLIANGARIILAGGAAVVSTVLDVSAFAPPPARLSQFLFLPNAVAGVSIQRDVGGAVLRSVVAGMQAYFILPLTPAQTIAYFNTAGGGATLASIEGYTEVL